MCHIHSEVLKHVLQRGGVVIFEQFDHLKFISRGKNGVLGIWEVGGHSGPIWVFFKSTLIFVIFSNEGWCSSISSVMTGHQNDNNFVLTPLHDGPRRGRRGPFLAKNLLFSTLHLHSPHFLVSEGPDSMGSYLPHILS